MRRTLLVVAALAAGCSADGGAPGNDGGGGGDGALLSDLSSSSTDLAGLPSVYPAGPYGNTVGMTMAPLLWEGYRDDLGDAVATSKPYGAYSMDDLRQSGRSYAIVHVAEFYWPGCQNAALDLAAQGKSVDDAGGAIVEILATKLGAAPTRNDLDAWVNGDGLPVTSVRDPDNLPLQSITELQRREIAYIVDLKTMKIVQRIDGSTSGAQPNAIRQAITQILMLLGSKNG